MATFSSTLFSFPKQGFFENTKHLCDCWLHLSDYSYELDLSTISQAANSRVPWTSYWSPSQDATLYFPPILLSSTGPLQMGLPLGINPIFELQLSECRRLTFMFLLVSEHEYFPRVSICCLPGQIMSTHKLLKHVIWTSWNRLDLIHTMWVARNVNTAKT